MKMLYVEWVDSARNGPDSVWKSADPSTYNTAKCKSCGFVIKETDDAITIAGHVSDQKWPDCSGDLTIPKVAITKRRVVRIAP